jgi:TPR repeat protein
MLLSQKDKLVLPALIWSLKRSDLSILHAALQEPGEVQIATTSDSGNYIFYSKLERLGLARAVAPDLDLPPQALKALDTTKMFSLSKLGRAELPALLEAALNSGYPPRDSIISSEAVGMLLKYSKQDDPPSQSKLAVLYEQGAGVEQNNGEALRWYQRAAAAGDLAATNNIGFLYFAGQGVERNIAEALRWFVRAAELGSTGAMDNIGEMYARGIGVEQSDTEAFQWFRKAADRGHGTAACKVGSCYGAGRGVAQDNVQAYLWFSVGIAAGLDSAQDRDAVASKLTPDQVKEANLLVSQWKPLDER